MIPIAFVIDTIETPSAGTEKQLLILIERLSRRSFAPHLIVLRDSEWLRQANLKCPVYNLDIYKFLSGRSLYAFWAFRRYCQKHDIQIVQTYFKDANLFGTVGAWLSGIETIISSRRNMGYWHTPVWIVILRMLRHVTDLYIANSQATADHLLDAEKVGRKKICVIYNGIQLDRYETIHQNFRAAMRKKLGIRQDELLIGAVANLRPIKNLSLLIEAAELLLQNRSDLRFIVVGEGDQRAELQERIVRAGLEDVFILAGRHEDVRPFLAAMDIGVLCSISEGLSNAILEYMVAGLPCIVSDVGGNREAIGDDSGLTFAPGDAKGLQKCIERLADDSQLRIEMSKAGRRRVKARHDFDQIIRMHEVIYTRCMYSGACHVGQQLHDQRA